MKDWKTPDNSPRPELNTTEREKRLARALLMCEAISLHYCDDVESDLGKAMGDIYTVAHSGRGECRTCAPTFETVIAPIEEVMIRNKTIDPLCDAPVIAGQPESEVRP